MSEKQKKSGVNRSHSRSFFQKVSFAFGHLVVVLFCVWIVYGDLLHHGWQLFGYELKISDYQRGLIMLGCTGVYLIRHVFTLFYLIVRKVDWSEVFGLLGFIALFEVGLTVIGAGTFRNYSIGFNYVDVVALALFLTGSFLNSFSEVQRKWWKAFPEHKGKCYTGGLFRYSMHINYFGDTVLFTGWCLFTHNIWTMIFPLIMGLSFVFFHIPGLDSYLQERYGSEFKAYSKSTKKFIPFLY